jgi:hypothetical protein
MQTTPKINLDTVQVYYSGKVLFFKKKQIHYHSGVSLTHTQVCKTDDQLDATIIY